MRLATMLLPGMVAGRVVRAALSTDSRASEDTM